MQKNRVGRINPKLIKFENISSSKGSRTKFAPQQSISPLKIGIDRQIVRQRQS
jgi:hypothetical protein